MKSVKRIYCLSESQSLLDKLITRVNLDCFIRSQANQYLSIYKEKKINWDESDSEYIVRVAIFIASKLKYPISENQSVVTLSGLLKELPSLDTFMMKLKEFINIIQLDSRITADIQSIVSNYAFSLTLYKKYEEIWAELDLPDDSFLHSIKKIGWIIFLLARVNLIQRRSEIVECACMLLAAVYTVITNSDYKPFSKFKVPEYDTLNTLCNIIKGQPDQIKISVLHLKRMLELFVHHQIVSSDFELTGIFSCDKIEDNYCCLGIEYAYKLMPSEFDQRLFIGPPEKTDCSNSCKFIVKKCIGFNFNVTSINPELKDYTLETRYFPVDHPIDPKTWLDEYINDTTPSEISIIGLETDKIYSLIEIQKDTLNKLFFKLLFLEKASPDTFRRANLVLCIEILKHVYKIKSIELKKIIQICGAPAFEVWKRIDLYLSSDIPKTLYETLKETQLILLTSIIWKETSFLLYFESFSKNKKDSSQLELKEFSKELFYYCSFALKEICGRLELSEKLQEDIWTVFKHCVTSKCKILLNRNLHQILACSIYGLCKAKNLNVTFNSIITKFCEIDPMSDNLFRKIELDDSIGDIIKYHNEEYLKFMKTHLLDIARNNHKNLYPFGPSNLNSVPGSSSPTPSFSGFYTPSTYKSFEFGEFSFESLNLLNQTIANKNLINIKLDQETLGGPTKKPKIFNSIFQDEDMLEDLPEYFPVLKKD